MIHLFKKINQKVNGLIWGFLSTGFILLMLSVLIVWTDFLLRWVVGLMILTVAYVFFYAGYKLWIIKKEIEKHFELKK